MSTPPPGISIWLPRTSRRNSMQLATVCAPAPDPRQLLAAYHRHLAGTGRGNTAYWQAARSFFSRWPDPAARAAEPLRGRLGGELSSPAPGRPRPGQHRLLAGRPQLLLPLAGPGGVGSGAAEGAAGGELLDPAADHVPDAARAPAA